ncbi:ABC transporter ATP-binding protein [Agromyces cerinus]|uniref:ABC-type quaternary amine transporter n=1 Tax=Agromyces cerinus subsp. cerinus TaxID=232089 RepID=A0A1N6HJT7_9MICO|nr:ABC transporter ATP-binding protein [Agromyces cerinus]SIO20030.1 iron(III) transport system ATP-binding protein [Agromyces cerinus subsp. cerinus]
MSLQLTGVSKSFGSQPVLDRVSFDVERGTRLAIVGASGSGKSTLLRIIAGFEQPGAGEVRLDDRLLASATTTISAHRRGIGYVAQDGALFPHLSVRGNIGFGIPRSAAREGRIREVMELTSLDADFLDRYPHQLSGGQQQRVALARALAPDPKVILLDEPFSALDTGLRAHTRAAMTRALSQSGVTTILVTHDQEEALSFGDQLAVIAEGRLVQAGRPAEVFDAPASAEIAEFLGAALFVPAHANADARAVCAFGDLPVRHDLSAGARSVRAMLRPSQLSVGDNAGGTAATVESARQSGSAVELELRFGSAAGFSLTHRVPLYEAHRFPVGRTVSVHVDGGVVLYPETAASDPVRSALAP